MALPDFENITEGYEIPSLNVSPITQTQLVRYAGASGDFNPIHTVPEKAKEAGLDGTIAHGMLIMGIMAKMITDWAGVKNVMEYSANFKGMTKPGDTLKVTAIVKRKYQDEHGRYLSCKSQVEDDKGEVKISGKFTIKY